MRSILRTVVILFSLAAALGAQESLVLDAATLERGVWGKTSYFGLSVSFDSKGGFEATYFDMSSGWTKRGIYSVRDGGVDLIALDEGGGRSILAEGGRLYYDPEGLEYPYWIEFDFGDYSCKAYDLSRPRPAGVELMIGGVAAVSTGMRKGRTSNDVKCRVAPSLSSSIVEADIEDPATGAQLMIPYVPKGRELKVLARTPSVEKVQSWTNYWYYVEFEYVAGPPDPVRGWMFGEFVTLEPGPR
jgi:hypothetical protein